MAVTVFDPEKKLYSVSGVAFTNGVPSGSCGLFPRA